MLKVENFKQETTVHLAGTKLWLFYKILPFSFLSSLPEQCHSNGHAPAWYFVFIFVFIVRFIHPGLLQ